MPRTRPATKPKLAPADPLKRAIQAVLREDDGSLADDRYRGGGGTFDGYGYVAAEAYWHLAGGKESGLRSMQLARGGTSRWWLVDEKGRVIDLALGRGEKSSFPYENGLVRAFRGTEAGISRGAKEIVGRVKSRA